MNAIITSKISKPAVDNRELLTPFSIGMIPLPNTGRKLSMSNLVRQRPSMATIRKMITGKKYSNDLRIRVYPPTTRYEHTHKNNTTMIFMGVSCKDELRQALAMILASYAARNTK